MLVVRGIRGATTVERDCPEDVTEAATELLHEIVKRNEIELDDVVAVIFTATKDLSSAYPAVAARKMGWNHIPLLCCQEMAVAEALPRCIRVLMLANTRLAIQDVRHVYLRGAKCLRTDISG